MSQIPRPRRTRSDALRNREQILNATVDLMVEQGPGVPLDMIAKRAKVGIATLYRHFPDRMVLLRQVTLGILTRSAEAAKRALDEEPDAFTALSRYLHDAIDLRIGVVMPMLARRVPTDDELAAAHLDSQNAMEALVKAAHAEESLRADVGSGDIGLLMIRMTPPLPVALSAEDNHRLSHRHMELMLDGLLSFLAVDSLPGKALELDQLNQIPQDEYGNFKNVLDDGADCYWRNRPTPANRVVQQDLSEPDAGNADRSTTNDS